MAALVPDEKVRENIKSNLLEKCKGSFARWTAFKALIKDTLNDNNYMKSRSAVNEVMVQYTYPRLDVNVSTGVNHLLKSPFCVHPKTGRVCVPMDPHDIDNFNPFSVPTVSQLCDELNTKEKSTENEENTPKRGAKDYRSTSLKESVGIFEKFLDGIEKTWRGKRIELSDSKKEF